MTETSPLADFRTLAETLPPPDGAAGEALRRRLCGGRAANRLEAVAVTLAEAQAKPVPPVRQPAVAVFVAAHGIAPRGVSSRGAGEVERTVRLLREGGAPLNGICAAQNLGLKVFELAPHLPTADFTLRPALDARACAATLAFGMEAAAGGSDLLVLAGLAAGGATSAAAVAAALFGGRGADWVADGLAEHLRLRRIDTIDKALGRHAESLGDPLAVLASLGGRETAAIAGAIAAARVQKAAVILDGDAALAAGLVLHALRPDAVRHCLLAQRPRCGRLAEAAAGAGLRPLLDLGLTGVGEAGAVAAGLARSAAGIAAAG